MSLLLNYDSLRREVGSSQGKSRDFTSWEAEDRLDVEDAIRSGLRAFYWPSGGYVWSFLTPVDQLELVSGDAIYDLPEGFTGVLGDFALASGPVSRVNEAKIRQLQLKAPQSGDPLHYAVRPKKADPSRYEVLFYPTPDSADVASFRYRLEPQELSENNKHPLGGPAHSETILAACCAALEKKIIDDEGVHAKRFAELLAASISIDQEMLSEGDVWPVENPSSELGINKAYLKRLIGVELGIGPNSAVWNNTETQNVKLALETALRSFYSPAVTSVGEKGVSNVIVHEWSFLKPLGKTSTTSGSNQADLPPDFAFLDGPLTYTDDTATRKVELTSDAKIRSIQRASGRPQYAALRTVDGGYKLVFDCPADDQYELEFRYRINPLSLESEASLPLGGDFHHQTLIDACLSAAEAIKGPPGVKNQSYQARLMASITRDQEIAQEDAEVWPTDNESVGLAVDKAYIQRLVGIELGYGPHSRAWNSTQSNEVKLAIESGLRNFYSSHQWEFLKPLGSVVGVVGQSAVDLPSDFVAFAGPLTYTSADNRKLDLVSDSKLRTLLIATSGQPLYAALRAKEVGYQLVFDRPCDEAYELQFRYTLSPSSLDSLTSVPLGGEVHHQTALEACLAAAEMLKGEPGAHTTAFKERLLVSIEQDKSLATGDADAWPEADEPQGLEVNRAYLKRLIGIEMGIGPNKSTWTNTESHKVALALETALRSFYSPAVSVQDAKGNTSLQVHEWSFLKLKGTTFTVDGQNTAPLPPDFALLEGPLTYTSDLEPKKIELTSDVKIRASQRGEGVPHYAHLRSTDQGYVLEFDCPADGAYEIQFRYRINPLSLPTEASLPMGGEQHHQAIIDACLMAAEGMKGPPGHRSQIFQARLAASVARDKEMSRGDAEVWPILEDTGLGVNKAYLERVIGLELGYGPNKAVWGSSESNKIKLALEHALRNFYNPARLPGDKTVHEWSFLRPVGRLEIKSGSTTLALPEDFSALDGPINYAPGENLYHQIRITSDQKVRQALATQQTGQPSCGAIRAKDGGYELVFDKESDGDYEIEFNYRINPTTLSEDAQLPLGGEYHHQTIIESCLAAAEVCKGPPGPRTLAFQSRLATSITRDRQTFAPHTLGYNTDPSSGEGVSYREMQTYVVQYNGLEY